MSKGAIIQLVNSNTPSGIAAALGFICLIIVIALTLTIGALTAITWLKQVRAGDLQARYYCKTKALGIIIPLLVLVLIVITENRLVQSLTYNKLSTFYYELSDPRLTINKYQAVNYKEVGS